MRLILMRHAKSSWDARAASDIDRPLNTRGARSAIALGNWLRQNGHMPTEALVSAAKRTMQTFEGLALECPVQFKRALYHAGPNAMMQVLGSATAPTVLMIGHNPGIAEFAERLVQTAPDHPRFYDYPTGATLVADFTASEWAHVDWHSGKVVDFVVPREL